MDKLVEIIEKAKALNSDLTLYGSQKPESIELLCKELVINLPNSYKNFLELYGGGGVETSDGWLSGIKNNDSLNKNRGYVYGDTLRIRSLYNLPAHLLVIYNDFADEEIYCLDLAGFDAEDECKVVEYNGIKNKVTGIVANNFLEFIKNYFN